MVVAQAVIVAQTPTPNTASGTENGSPLKNCPKIKVPAARFALSDNLSASSLNCAFLNGSIVTLRGKPNAMRRRRKSQGSPRFPEWGLFIEEPTISPDGRWLVYNRGSGGSSLWVLTIGSS